VVLGGCGLLPGQSPPKVPLIGYLNNNFVADVATSGNVDAFRLGLSEQGLVEGQTVAVEWRFGNGDNERMPRLAQELVELGVRLIVASGTASSVTHEITTTVPIVAITNDPVAAGLAASLGRPGGNVTGIDQGTSGSTGTGKRLQLLTEVAPSARRLAVLTNLGSRPDAGAAQAAAELLGLQVLVVDVRTLSDVEPALNRAQASGADVLDVDNLVPLNSRRELVASFAAEKRLPASYIHRAFVVQGGLLSWGSDTSATHRRAAWYVSRILKGADPAELPIEQLAKFEFVINRKALADLGLAIPPDVAAQVTEWVL
jgi:putative ABC transport system substrate-binding protein